MWILIFSVSENIGLGHLFRCLTIMEKIGTKNCEVYIITRWDKSKIKNYFCNDNFRTFTNVEKLTFQKDLKNYSVLIDLTTIPKSLLTKTKSAKKKLLLGQSGDITQWADLVVNSAEGRQLGRNKWYCDNSKTEFWEGACYAILRDTFLIDNKPKRGDKIFVMMGGTDPANYTFRVIKTLNEYFDQRDIVTVVNDKHTDFDGLVSLSSNKKNKVNIELQRSDIEVVMKGSFCAVVSPGVTLFECLALGIPTIAVAQNERQVKDFKKYPLLVNKFTPKSLLNNVKKVERAPSFWVRYSQNLKSGQNLNELINWMKN